MYDGGVGILGNTVAYGSTFFCPQIALLILVNESHRLVSALLLWGSLRQKILPLNLKSSDQPCAGYARPRPTGKWRKCLAPSPARRIPAGLRSSFAPASEWREVEVNTIAGVRILTKSEIKEISVFHLAKFPYFTKGRVLRDCPQVGGAGLIVLKWYFAPLTNSPVEKSSLLFRVRCLRGVCFRPESEEDEP